MESGNSTRLGMNDFGILKLATPYLALLGKSRVQKCNPQIFIF
jgi:hypothetical protein